MTAPSRAIFWTICTVTAVICATMLLGALPRMAAEPGGLKAPDLHLSGYGKAGLEAFQAALSEKGRGLHFGFQRWLDIGFAVLLAKFGPSVGAWRVAAMRKETMQ